MVYVVAEDRGDVMKRASVMDGGPAHITPGAWRCHMRQLVMSSADALDSALTTNRMKNTHNDNTIVTIPLTNKA